MASFNVTISNSLNVFGGSPSDLWNAYNWNAFKWGDGTSDLPVTTLKIIDSGSIASDSSNNLSAYFFLSVANEISSAFEMGSEKISDGSGYYYVFPGNTTEAESRVIPVYTEGSSTTPTWTSGSVSSPSWSSL